MNAPMVPTRIQVGYAVPVVVMEAKRNHSIVIKKNKHSLAVNSKGMFVFLRQGKAANIFVLYASRDTYTRVT